MITYEYFNGKNKSKPPMSSVLEGYIKELAKTMCALKMHIVHCGTKGDAKHAPSSFHCLVPPRAIDILKLYVHTTSDEKLYDMRRLEDRKKIAKLWVAVGGITKHASNSKVSHLHCQTRTRHGST